MDLETIIKDRRAFQAFTEQVGGVSIFDLEGRYVYVNHIWEEVQGRTLNEVKGVQVEKIVPNSLVRQVLRTEQPMLGFPVLDESSKIWVINYCPLFVEGQLMGCAMVSIFNDKKQTTKLISTLQKLTEQISFYQRTLGDLQGAKYNINNIIGETDCMRELRRQIQQAAAAHSNVLIEGETGCGKELVAHSIHSMSARAMNPFVKLNCAAIPLELAESELFGYDSGAFTGAKKEGRKGKFEQANTGSLFLDEINQLPYAIQPKLLRTLQEREIERVGGSGSISLDMRIIAATNQSLEQLIVKNEFREDLYYRLNVLKIRVPPLRERLEDIPLLARHYIRLLNGELGTTVSGISDGACAYLMSYRWPGNIRELRNALERAMNIRLHGVLEQGDFENILEEKPVAGTAGHTLRIHSGEQYRQAREEFDRSLLLATLESCGWNVKQASERLGLSRAMLYKKLDRYDIKRPAN